MIGDRPIDPSRFSRSLPGPACRHHPAIEAVSTRGRAHSRAVRVAWGAEVDPRDPHGPTGHRLPADELVEQRRARRRRNSLGGCPLWPSQKNEEGLECEISIRSEHIRETELTSSWTRGGVVTIALFLGTFGGEAQANPNVRTAQGTVTIPTDAQINRMERDSITTSPLDVSEGVRRGGEASQIRQMDRRDHRVDQRLLKHDGVCDDC